MNVFITGASGLVGSRLIAALRDRGDSVVTLSRKPTPGGLVGDPAQPGSWQDALADCDAVVHLAGENIFAHRWTAAFMQRIRDSRVNSTRLIAETLAKTPGRTKVLISASAVGYYGNRGDEVLTEASSPGSGFMADVCREWETAADPARAAVRVVHPRLGIVLDPKGGALPTLLRPYKLFAGGRIGSGRQFFSWIHHTDLTRLLLFALDTATLTGPCNATSPNPVTNDTLGRTIGKVLHRPHWLPAPGFALRLALGKIAESILGGQRVLPQRLTDAGFTFRFADLEAALRDVTGR
ncbi:TIGR01777 family protein [Limnoglobus roseus]|uniref:TIGR01777 family protein n=2 Tax=Limnoglobus roseus TaxID=2598579 RepID=A0A5C1ANY5_9BACT|nr:TIGR01777 family protein [Limnoglobus roseus]